LSEQTQVFFSLLLKQRLSARENYWKDETWSFPTMLRTLWRKCVRNNLSLIHRLSVYIIILGNFTVTYSNTSWPLTEVGIPKRTN
jgi:hypothetical protein